MSDKYSQEKTIELQQNEEGGPQFSEDAPQLSRDKLALLTYLERRLTTALQVSSRAERLRGGPGYERGKGSSKTRTVGGIRISHTVAQMLVNHLKSADAVKSSSRTLSEARYTDSKARYAESKTRYTDAFFNERVTPSPSVRQTSGRYLPKYATRSSQILADEILAGESNTDSHESEKNMDENTEKQFKELLTYMNETFGKVHDDAREAIAKSEENQKIVDDVLAKAREILKPA